MGICTICCEETDADERAPDERPLCPGCARLLRWFLDLDADVEFRVPEQEHGELEAAFCQVGADSLDAVELIMEAEEQLGVTAGDVDVERIQAVARYARDMRRHGKKGPGRAAGGRDPLWDRELDG